MHPEIQAVIDDIAGKPTDSLPFKSFDLGDPAPDDKLLAELGRTMRRSVLSADAVLTASEVIEALGGRAGVVRDWLRSTVVPLRHPSGRQVYRWGDVLDAMRRAA